MRQILFLLHSGDLFKNKQKTKKQKMVKQRDQGQILILDVDTILIQRFISLTKCPGIWPVFLHLVLWGSWVFCQILSSIPVVFFPVYSLICQATSLVREGNEVCLVPVEPTLCARIVVLWVVTNHSSNDFPRNFVRDQQSVPWCCRILGFFFFFLSFLSKKKKDRLFSCLSFWKWEFYFLHLQSLGTKSVSPSAFTRRKIQRAINFQVQIAFTLRFWWLMSFLPILW